MLKDCTRWMQISHPYQQTPSCKEALRKQIIQNTKIEHYLFLLKFAQSLVSPGQIAEIQIVLIY